MISTGNKYLSLYCRGHQTCSWRASVLQSLVPTPIKHTEAANQGLAWYTWNSKAGVLRQVGPKPSVVTPALLDMSFLAFV